MKIIVLFLLIALGGLIMANAREKALKVGDQVSDFSGPMSDGTTFQLRSCLAKAPIVLYFYPKDDTPGCTAEACSLRDDFSAFRNLKTVVIGVSYDSIESHKKFIAKHKLPFPLISDKDKSISKIFGVAGALFPARSTFIIGKDGTILYANPSVSPQTNSKEVQDALTKINTGK